MNYTLIKKLPAVGEIIQTTPLSEAGHQQIQKDRQEVKEIIEGRDPRLLIVVGPCSAWPSAAVLEYAQKLSQFNETVKKSLKLVMRVYIQKPRTTKGWTGPVNQPDPLAYPDIEAGMKYCREMMVKIVEMGLPIADEALFTHHSTGFLELLSWVAIGARSTEDQEHRIHASCLPCAVGMKNPTHGSLSIAVNGIIAAQHPHVAVFDGYEVQTHGNPHAHLVLRGGNNAPNYGVPHLEEAQRHMKMAQIKNPAIMIDVSHDNCLAHGKKDHQKQPEILLEILDSIEHRPELKALVKGFMIESFLKDGNQKIDGVERHQIDLGGLSITDPCIGFEKTAEILMKIAERRGL